MGLLTTLGFNWTTFFSQLLNFAILYFILKRFALEKIIKAMDKRQGEIAAGIRNAQTANMALEQAKAQQEEILATARKEAKAILAESRHLATQQEEKLLAQAKGKAARIVAAGESQVQANKNKMLLEVKTQLAQLIALGIEKVSGEQISAQTINHRYLESGLKA